MHTDEYLRVRESLRRVQEQLRLLERATIDANNAELEAIPELTGVQLTEAHTRKTLRQGEIRGLIDAQLVVNQEIFTVAHAQAQGRLMGRASPR